MTLPPVSLVRQDDTHRLIPSKYSDSNESVLVRLVDNDEDLKVVFDLDNATNDRLLAERNLLPGIGVNELVFNVPHSTIINAAFCHAHPQGSRFNGPDRGAWYAAFELETSQAEVGYHEWLELLEVNWLEEEVTFDDYRADFGAEFHDIRSDTNFRKYLNPESYESSQKLALELQEVGSLGIVYPSVRNNGGTCLACFRPALVNNVRQGSTYLFRWEGKPKPLIEVRRGRG
jgi:RES domain